MYQYETKPYLQKILKKLHKKDKRTYEAVLKKIEEIIHCKDIEHYKNLRNPLQHLKKVQIGSFVLVFRFDKKIDFLSFENFGHHDKIYLLDP